MSQWWTYGPSDFLMFSPRIYWRLFESINEAWWPLQPLALALGLGGLALLMQRRRQGRDPGGAAWRAAAAVFAAAWALVAWAFLLQRLAPINWPAGAFALAFAAQAVGLAALAALGGLRGQPSSPRFRAGVALGLWALLGHPLLAVVFARPWRQAELAGLAPDPTAIATLALLLLLAGATPARRALLRALWLLPLAWCVVSAATLATMGSAQAAVVLAAAVLAVVAARWR